jgi:hypothetical protein
VIKEVDFKKPLKVVHPRKSKKLTIKYLGDAGSIPGVDAFRFLVEIGKSLYEVNRCGYFKNKKTGQMEQLLANVGVELPTQSPVTVGSVDLREDMKALTGYVEDGFEKYHAGQAKIWHAIEQLTKAVSNQKPHLGVVPRSA